jgi:transketolase
VSLAHVHVSTLKPFRAADILELAASCRSGVVTLENHSVIGGLGSCVAEALADAGIGRRLVRLGLQDVYAHGASSRYLMREYGIDAAALIAAIEGLVGRRFGIDPDGLAEVVIPPAGGGAKAEAL